MQGYANEYYVEKKGTSHRRAAVLHFYQLTRAQEALVTLRSCWHAFENYELICHQKEIGISQDGIGFSSGLTVEPAKKQRSDKYAMDDDGFTVIKKK